MIGGLIGDGDEFARDTPINYPIPQSPDPITQSPDYPISRRPSSSAVGRHARLELVVRSAPRPHDPRARLRRAAVPGRPRLRARRCGLRDPGLHRPGHLCRRHAPPVGSRRQRRARRAGVAVGAAGPSRRRRAAPASIAHDYAVDDDGELCCQWDPVIPFAGARLEQRFDIDLDASSRLLLERRADGRPHPPRRSVALRVAHARAAPEHRRLAHVSRTLRAGAQRSADRAAMDGRHSVLPRDRACPSRPGDGGGGRGAAIRNQGRVSLPASISSGLARLPGG